MPATVDELADEVTAGRLRVLAADAAASNRASRHPGGTFPDLASDVLLASQRSTSIDSEATT